MKVLFTYDYGKENMDRIKELGYEVVLKAEDGITVTKDIEDIDVLNCYTPFTTLDIKKIPTLKWIQLSSIGIDQLPKEDIKNIIVTNNKGGYSIPIGEWIVLKALEIYKDSKYFYEYQNSRKWKTNTSIQELTDKKVLFLGTGTIALEASKRLRSFVKRIDGVNTNGRAVEGFDICHSIKDIDDYIGDYDLVVICLPHTKSTHHLFDKELISKMRDDSVLINIARGAIIHEESLISALEEGKFLGVALDVFEKEPLNKESKLFEFDRAYLSPHNSWISEKRNQRRFELIYYNMKAFIEDKPLTNVVNIQKGY